MRPIHTGNIDAIYQQAVNSKAVEFSAQRAELYRLDAEYKRNKSEENKKALKVAKDKYKDNAHCIYSKALAPLKKRIGSYCSYCEREYSTNLAIEHKCPKDLKENWNLILNWNNFLLSCSTCNGIKSDDKIFKTDLETFLFPDNSDTYHAFEYTEKDNYTPRINLTLITNANQIIRARRTINILKLNKKDNPEESATRCFKRREKATQAKKWFKVIEKYGLSEEFLQLIKGDVSGGCWSIWMRTFEDIPEIKEEILYGLPNTAIEYFIDDYWEHEKFFNGQHTQTEYFNRLITIIKSRIAYCNGHKDKMSIIQLDGVKQWTSVFVDSVCKNNRLTKDQIIRVQDDMKLLNGIR